jgi:hypothetical protein
MDPSAMTSSALRGVSWDKTRRWRAAIRIDGAFLSCPRSPIDDLIPSGPSRAHTA